LKTPFESTLHALNSGYKAIDTASIYRNESEIGNAIKAWVDTDPQNNYREDIFVTTKISPYEMGFEDAKLAFKSSLERLDLDYVDLLLIHWPGKAKQKLDDPLIHKTARFETWRAFQDIKKSGKAKFIGVSNFTVSHLKDGILEEFPDFLPHVNQVECHLLLQQHGLREYCKHHQILLQGYSPLGGSGSPILQHTDGNVKLASCKVIMRFCRH
jgi:methylglyoxal/glyoxal reductase